MIDLMTTKLLRSNVPRYSSSVRDTAVREQFVVVLSVLHSPSRYGSLRQGVVAAARTRNANSLTSRDESISNARTVPERVLTRVPT